MAIHIPRTSVQVQGMPVDKLIDTINNHRDIPIGAIKELWDALPQSLRNAVANKVEGWGESISGSHQREFDESLAEEPELDPSRYNEDQIKAIKNMTPEERDFVTGQKSRLRHHIGKKHFQFNGTPDEYLQRAVDQAAGKQINATPEQSDEFQKAFREYDFNPQISGISEQLKKGRSDTADFEDLFQKYMDRETGAK